MPIPNTILIAFGPEQCVLDLADGRLAGSLLQRNAIGDKVHGNEESESNSVIIELPTVGPDSINEAEDWIRTHAEHLIACHAEKIIEFQTILEPNIGSRILTLPNSIIKLCADTGLGIANQSFQVFSDGE